MQYYKSNVIHQTHIQHMHINEHAIPETINEMKFYTQWMSVLCRKTIKAGVDGEK